MRERSRTTLVLGCGLVAVGVLMAACTEAPTSSREPTGPTVRPDATTTEEQPPPDPLIYYASTFVAFYNGEFGGGPQGEILADMDYRGNRASHDIDFSATRDDGQPFSNRPFHDSQNGQYDVTPERPSRPTCTLSSQRTAVCP